MTDITPRSAELDQLAELIDDIEIAQLTTVRQDGTLHSRPMATHAMRPNGSLCFLTSRESGKVAEIEDRQHVHLGYADPSSSKYVSVSGHAYVSENPALIRELWTPASRVWFHGPDDPDIVALRVVVDEAEFWDAPKGGRPVQLLRLAGTGAAAAG